MPNPRQRRLMRRQIGVKVLQPAGLTNADSADIGVKTREENLLKLALWSSGGYSPLFTNGARSASIDFSKQQYGAYTSWDNFVLASGLNGQFSGSAFDNVRHYSLASMAGGTISLDYSSSNQPTKTSDGGIVVYTANGIQASYNAKYLGGTSRTSTALFGNQLTGSQTHVQFSVIGQLPTNDVISIVSASSNTAFTGVDDLLNPVTASVTGSTSMVSYIYISTASINAAGGFKIVHRSQNNTSVNYNGVFCIVSASNLPVIVY